MMVGLPVAKIRATASEDAALLAMTLSATAADRLDTYDKSPNPVATSAETIKERPAALRHQGRGLLVENTTGFTDLSDIA